MPEFMKSDADQERRERKKGKIVYGIEETREIERGVENSTLRDS